MSTTTTKEMDTTKQDLVVDDVGVNKSDRIEGENIQILQNPDTAKKDEEEKRNEDGEGEEEADRHVILTPSRRIRPGTMTEDINMGFPLDLSEADSWFHQEDHLNQLLSSIDPANLTSAEAASLAEPPANTDPNLWIYEWLRRLTKDLNLLVVAMLEDGCSSTNCPEMRTLDCQYLCATHDKPRECPATDYIIHTLDYTTALLNSSKLFPSRVMIQDGPMQYLHSSARRLYRVFIHAYEHHNEMFRAFENETGTYTLFLAVAERLSLFQGSGSDGRHGLVPRELITIPADYKDTTDEQDDYSRPTQQGNLFEVAPSTPLTNGDID